MSKTVRERIEKSRVKLRYAVVGLGHIAQVAVLPAFAHAKRNSELVALVSGDKAKLRVLGKKYGVKTLWSYRDYAKCLACGAIDAVYIALPNHQHLEAVVAAARAGIHVLCEKPLAVTEADCRAMISAAAANRVRLMTAYRLHLDPATLQIMDWVRRGKIGDPSFMQAVLSMTVKDPKNIRRNARKLGGGPLFDLGVYCINAARTFFRAEPEQVTAQMIPASGRKNVIVEETLTGLLRFPGQRLATFACSTAAASLSEFTLAGDQGIIRLDGAFTYSKPRHLSLIQGEERRVKKQLLGKHDQFAAELLYFSDCVLQKHEAQPSGWEGLADIRVIQALYRSARTGRSQRLSPFKVPRRPQKKQGIHRPPVAQVKIFHAKAP
jgi:glucose-fructose oxidoreductase